MLTVAALAIRWRLATQSGLWRDEGLFLFIVRMPTIGDMLRWLVRHESHPPLFYLLIRGWRAIVGPSTSATLALPVLFGILLVPVVYLAALRSLTRTTAVVAAVFVALSPPLAEYSASVRPYSLLALLCCISTLLLWMALTGGSTASWAGYGAATVAMLYTHNYAWLVLAAQWCVVAAAPLLLRTGPRIWLKWLLCQAVIFVAFAPWLPKLLYQARHAGEPLPYIGTTGQALWIFEHATVYLSVPATIALCVVLLSAALVRYFLGGRHYNGERLLAVTLYAGTPVLVFIEALALSRYRDLIVPWCLSITAPCMLLAIAYGCTAMLPWTRLAGRQPGGRNGTPQRALSSGVRAVVALAFLPVLLVAAVARIYASDAAAMVHQRKSNAREFAAALVAEALPGDLIVVTPEWYASSFNYYYPGGQQQIDFPSLNREGATPFNDVQRRFADPAAMRGAVEAIAAARRQGRRVWLITGADLLDTMLAGNRPHSRSEAIQRTWQLYRELVSLYGPPGETLVYPAATQRMETLCGAMFAPSPRAGA